MSPHHRSRPPKVLLVYMDDLAWGDLACHGNPYTRTPHLDRLFAQSTRLTRYHSYPVCTPARAALMTGRYAPRTRAVDTYCGRAMMDPDEYTLAEMFRDAGYATCISGKWHLGDCYPTRPIDQGFDEALVHLGGGLCQPSNYFEHGGYFHPDLLHNGRLERCEGYCTDIFADHTLRFIEAHRDEPFFCYLATNAPHGPLLVDDAWAQRYLDMDLPEPWARLYGMVENIDYNVGRVLDKLDELDIPDDTVVMFSSDHGPCRSARDDRLRHRWNGGLRGEKGTPYDGGLRVPCFIRWPGVLPAGRNVDRLAAPMDIMPTLASLCGTKLPEDRTIDGVDLSPLLRDEVLPHHWPDRQLFIQWHRSDKLQRYRNFAVVEQRWKLLCSRLGPHPAEDARELKKLTDPKAVMELYDLEHDPGERHDLAGSHPEILGRVCKAYDAWFDEICRTRGDDTFAPPPIHLGTEHENPTVLTCQDWRMYGSEDSYTTGPPGFWIVRIAESGRYTIRVRLPREHKGGTLRVNWAGQTYEQPVPSDQRQAAFDNLELNCGTGGLEAMLYADGEPSRVDFVYVRCDNVPVTNDINF